MEIDQIKQLLEPFSVVSRFGHVADPRQGKNIRCPNQSHAQTGDSPPCSMDYKTGLWKCHGCDARGDLLDFIGYALYSDYNRVTRPHFREILDLIATQQIKPMPEPERQARLKDKPNWQFDKNWLLDWTDNLLQDKLLLSYLQQRGVDKTIVPYQIGYTAQDQRLPVWAHHYITIPYIYRGVVTGIKLRGNPFLIKDKDKRFRAMGSFPMPFNADAINSFCERLFIQEAELDALALMELISTDCSIAYPASELDTFDMNLLHQVRQPILIADNDDRGRAVAKTMKARCHRLKVVYPVDMKDLGEHIVDIGRVVPYWLRSVCNDL